MDKEHLFHYTRSENYRKILDEQTLLFNNIHKTNDSYENKKFDFFDITEIRKDEKSYETDDKKRWFFNQLNRIKNRIVRSLSLSKGIYNFNTLNEKNRPGYFLPRMWAQYGNNSKGVCFVFDKAKLLEQLKANLDDQYHFFDGSIEYRDITEETYSLSLEKIIKNRRNEVFRHINANKQELMIKNIHDYYFVKDTDWKEENEYRVIIINKKDNKNTEAEIVKIEMDKVIECVIIGENFGIIEDNDYYEIDQKQIDMIRSLCIKHSVSLKKNLSKYL
ncbi:MAG: DUF2971 domain-containing protein [Treponema sp.]